ncbi:MAG: GLPGLI family protein [Bacteroidetes bacterium]|nr:GLPGLI family protein [Bacteroidota bacterium]
MKYLFFFFCVVAATGAVRAQLSPQVHRGVIHYERKIDVHRHLSDPQMRATVPQFQTAAYDLLFDDSISVYKATPKDEAPDPFEASGGGNRIVMRFGGPGDDGILYENHANGRLLEETTLEEKKYLISDSIRDLSWKLSEERGSVLGHDCKKATATNMRGIRLVAWYSEDIAAPVGPEKFGGLPGAILRLDADSGGIVFTATRVDPFVPEKELRAPGGKAITRADYEKLLDKVMGPADAQGRRMTRRMN